MLLELSPDQEFFRETTAKFLAAFAPADELRRLRDDPAGFGRDYWRRGAELGWTSLLVDEAHGGGTISGDGVVDLTLVAHEFGLARRARTARADERRRRRAERRRCRMLDVARRSRRGHVDRVVVRTPSRPRTTTSARSRSTSAVTAATSSSTGRSDRSSRPRVPTTCSSPAARRRADAGARADATRPASRSTPMRNRRPHPPLLDAYASTTCASRATAVVGDGRRGRTASSASCSSRS